MGLEQTEIRDPGSNAVGEFTSLAGAGLGVTGRVDAQSPTRSQRRCQRSSHIDHIVCVGETATSQLADGIQPQPACSKSQRVLLLDYRNQRTRGVDVGVRSKDHFGQIEQNPRSRPLQCI